MRAHLHRSVFTPFLYHFVQEHVDGEGVGSGLLCSDRTAVDVVAYGRQKPGLVTAQTSHFIDERGRCGLSVCTGDAYEPEPARGVAVPLRGEEAERYGAVVDLYVGHAVEKRVGHRLDNYCGGMLIGKGGYECVAVDCHAAHCHKHGAVGHLARVVGQRCDRAVGRADCPDRIYRAYQMLKIMLHIYGYLVSSFNLRDKL